MSVVLPYSVDTVFFLAKSSFLIAMVSKYFSTQQNSYYIWYAVISLYSVLIKSETLSIQILFQFLLGNDFNVLLRFGPLKVEVHLPMTSPTCCFYFDREQSALWFIPF